jgi:hypothetical protein
MLASRHGKTDVMTLLLQRGANLHTQAKVQIPFNLLRTLGLCISTTTVKTLSRLDFITVRQRSTWSSNAVNKVGPS